MTDHDERMLSAWFDAGEVRGSEAALERALAAAKGKPQRAGWLVSVRGGTIAGDPRSSSVPVSLVAALALMALLAIALAFAAGGPNLPIVVPSPGPEGSTLEPSPTAAATAAPIVAAACGTGRTVITAAPSGAPVPVEAQAIRAPQGGRVAVAIEDQLPLSAEIQTGSILVAGPDRGSAQVIATFTGEEILGNGTVGIFGWSASGESLLVYAGSDDTLTADRICGNLWVVRADGSTVTRITDNGPREAIDQAAFSPGSTSVAYVQANVLHVLDLAGDEQTIPIGTCNVGSHRLHWAPDERKVLLVCDLEVVVLDRDAETARRLAGATGYLLDAAWSPNSQSIVAAIAEDGGPVTILDIEIADGSRVTRAQSDHSSTWVADGQTLSPDGRWLLVRGDVDAVDGEPTYLIETTTGRSTSLPWPVVGDTWFVNSLGAPVVTWLEGNDRVLAAEGRTLYEVDLARVERTAVGSVVPGQPWAVFMIPR